MTDAVWGILIAVAFVFGVLGGFLAFKLIPIFKAKEASKKSEKIIHDAEIKADQIRKNAQIDAKQTVNELKQEAEKEISEIQSITDNNSQSVIKLEGSLKIGKILLTRFLYNGII